MRIRMNAGWIWGIVLPVLLAAGPTSRPFEIDWSKAERSQVDLSSFLRAPAGQGGFIRVEGEHLVRPDGSRWRIWGVNLCAGECFPEKADAPLIAGDLARLGVNCVRFHHMDAHWGRNIFDPAFDDTRHLSAESLDRLDFFIGELKKRGIYANLNLNVHRQFKAGDGVRDFKILGVGKSATYFNPRLIELQQEYARQLLSHRNPYTGNTYATEPAVATVEIVNENSVLEGWAGWRLVGRDDKAGDTWSPLPVSYAEELTDLYNQWLEANTPAAMLEAIRKEAGGGKRVPRLMPSQFAQASKARFHAETRFYMEVERRFFEGMKRLLKEEIGVRSALVGTADHNDGISAYPHLQSNLLFDIIDGHGYWEHPNLGKETWIKNTPMVNDPLDSTVTQFARTPVAGRPFTISETNHPFPHEYACEGIPVLTAYALMHDWDGIYWFNYGMGRTDNGWRGMGNWFDLGNDPVKVTNLAVCGLMWHRQALKPAERVVVRSYSPEEVIESLRMDRNKERPFFRPGFARSTALVHKTRGAFDGSAGTGYPEGAPLGRTEAETGQIGWYDADKKRGVVAIDAPGAQGLVGFVKGSGRGTTHLEAEVENEFCAILLTSMDGRNVTESGRLVLAAMARSGNTGMKWKEDRQTLAEWGKRPAWIEPVVGRVVLKGLAGAKGVRVRPMTAEGGSMGEGAAAERVGKGWGVKLGEPTTWMMVEVER